MLEKSTTQSNSKLPLIFKIAAGALGLIVILFFILTLVFFIASSSKKSEAEVIKKDNDKLVTDIKKLDSGISSLIQNNEELTARINGLKVLIAKLLNDSKALNDLKNAQQKEIDSLKLTNLILWIGGGTSLATGLGGAGYGIYANGKTSETAVELAKVKAKYDHYLAYYLEGYPWLVEDYMINYFADYVTWEPLYDSREHGWSRTALVDRITGDKVPKLTTTVILTDKNWMVTGTLSKAWLKDGSFVADQHAFLMAVNRIDNTYIYDIDSSKKAARLNTSALIEFGDGEIIVYENKTGMAVEGRTYKSYQDVDKNLFYAGEPVFNVVWVAVYGHHTVRRLRDDHHKREFPRVPDFRN